MLKYELCKISVTVDEYNDRDEVNYREYCRRTLQSGGRSQI